MRFYDCRGDTTVLSDVTGPVVNVAQSTRGQGRGWGRGRGRGLGFELDVFLGTGGSGSGVQFSALAWRAASLPERLVAGSRDVDERDFLVGGGLSGVSDGGTGRLPSWAVASPT